MYGQAMYGPMYGMYGFPPGAAGEAGQLRGWQQQEREPAPIKFTEGKLFIGGVDAHTITKDELVQYCSRWGEVSDAVVMDKKNYGFVTFGDPKNAMKFLETRVHELKGRKLDAKAAVPKAHLGTAKLTKKMFVGGTGDLTDEDFKEHFAQFGEIEDAAVVRREGMSRGFGFVTFADEISVEKCLLVNHYIKGRKVELKRAVPKEDLGAAAAAAAAGGLPAMPGMMQGPYPQQLYPYPYGPAAPYPVTGPMRPPGAYPAPAAAPMQLGPMAHDPYAAWYGMGYMPYPYPPHPAAGMYPYGLVPQPGMTPYTGMGPFVGHPPGMAPAAAAAAATAAAAAGAPSARMPMGSPSAAAPPTVPPAGLPSAGAGGVAGLQQEPPFLQTGRPAGSRSHGQAAGSSRGRSPAGGRPSGSEAAAGETAAAERGSTSGAPRQQQQQQREPHAVCPAGPSTSSTEPAAAAGQAGTSAVRPGQATELSPTGSSPVRLEGQKQQQPLLHGAVAAVAAAASAPAAAGMVGGLPGQQQAMQLPPGGAAGGGRRPVVMAYPMVPGFMPHPQPLPLPSRAMMGPAGMQQGQMQPGSIVPGGAGGVLMPPGFTPGPRGGAPGNGGAGGPSSTGGPSAGKS